MTVSGRNPHSPRRTRVHVAALSNPRQVTNPVPVTTTRPDRDVPAQAGIGGG
jgi:hypothetical protein